MEVETGGLSRPFGVLYGRYVSPYTCSGTSVAPHEPACMGGNLCFRGFSRLVGVAGDLDGSAGR